MHWDTLWNPKTETETGNTVSYHVILLQNHLLCTAGSGVSAHEYHFLCVLIKCVGSATDVLCQKKSELEKRAKESGLFCAL